jgi:hypothetical protein
LGYQRPAIEFSGKIGSDPLLNATCTISIFLEVVTFGWSKHFFIFPQSNAMIRKKTAFENSIHKKTMSTSLTHQVHMFGPQNFVDFHFDVKPC